MLENPGAYVCLYPSVFYVRNIGLCTPEALAVEPRRRLIDVSSARCPLNQLRLYGQVDGTVDRA